jgi:hypothetical protein
MKKREQLDAEIEEIHKELARIGVGGSPLQPSRLAGGTDPEDGLPDAEKRIVMTSSQLPTSAFQLAGYLVATLALGRSIPATIVLEADAEYDVGRCSETDLYIIWAVGDLAAERARGDGHPWEPGPSIVIFKMESDNADPFHRESGKGTPDRDQTANRILNENWHDIVRVSRRLAERRTLSRADIEAEVFQPGE